MKFETYLLLAFLIFCVWRTHRSVQRSQTPRERFFVMRVSIFGWFLVFLLLMALVFLPGKALLLLLLPVVLGGIGVARFLSEARARLRRQNEERVDLERMKRVN